MNEESTKHPYYIALDELRKVILLIDTKTTIHQKGDNEALVSQPATPIHQNFLMELNELIGRAIKLADRII